MPFTIQEERLQHESAKQFAFRVLRRNIMRLDMLPGEIIPEKHIAKEMNLSRTPVREALLELSRQKLVDIVPQKNTRVALMDAKMIEQGRFLRDTIEVAVLERVCKGIEPCFHAALQENLARQADLSEHKDVVGFFIVDNEFHQILFKAAQLETVYEVLSAYVPHFSRERMLRLQMFDTAELLQDHRAIAEAVRSHDVRAAKLSMSRHLDRVVCDQKILREAFPTYYVRD